MAKKHMDILLGNILGSAAITPQDRYEEPDAPLIESLYSHQQIVNLGFLEVQFAQYMLKVVYYKLP